MKKVLLMTALLFAFQLGLPAVGLLSSISRAQGTGTQTGA